MGKSLESGPTQGSGVALHAVEKTAATASTTSASKVRDMTIKYGALALLVLQNTFLVVFMRYSRTASASSSTDPKYSSATAVFCMEVRAYLRRSITSISEYTVYTPMYLLGSFMMCLACIYPSQYIYVLLYTFMHVFNVSCMYRILSSNIPQVVKLFTCFAIIIAESGRGVRGLIDCLALDVMARPDEMMKISVPSLVYTVQNNLLYFALSHLDAATYMVCYQVSSYDHIGVVACNIMPYVCNILI